MAMTNEEIVLKIQKGQRHLQTDLFLQNENFLRQFANKYSFGNPEDYDDLMQEMAIMLFRCADKYNENGGANFISFSYKWLQQACVRFLNRKRLIYVPPDRLPTLRKYAKLKEDGLSDSEIMSALHLIDRYQLEEIQREAASLLPAASLSAPIDGESGEEGVLADTLPDPAGQDPFMEVEAALDEVRLSRMIAELREPYRTVLHLTVFENMPQVQIAERLKVSRQYVSSITRKARILLADEVERVETAERIAYASSKVHRYMSGRRLSVVEEAVLGF
jgi:RNA polymerase sigma factor (sigma-70 family)